MRFWCQLAGRPFLKTHRLEAAGVQTNGKGIVVDATLRTTVPHIWAAGDVASPYQFTHVASKQGEIAAHKAFVREPQPFTLVSTLQAYPTLAEGLRQTASTL